MMRDHKPVSIADQVFEQLERDILSGKYPQGEVLSELRLSGELGVSRTPIREALQQLQSEGLVEVVPRVGTFVRQPSRREVVELFQLKSVLEGLGAQLLAQRGRVAETELLQANLADSEAAVRAGDMERYAQLVHEFHGLIVQGADNHRLAAHYSSLMNQLAYHRIVVNTVARPERLKASDNEHHSVVEAIKSKDALDAEFTMRNHVRASSQAALRPIDEPQPARPGSIDDDAQENRRVEGGELRAC